MYKLLRVKRHKKIRKKIIGTSSRPRLSVFRSGKHIYAQIIDDNQGKTILAESDLKLDASTGSTALTTGSFSMKKVERAFIVGKKLAQKALKKKIKEVVFDRGGFLYHGRVAELARGAREGGLEF